MTSYNYHNQSTHRARVYGLVKMQTTQTSCNSHLQASVAVEEEIKPIVAADGAVNADARQHVPALRVRVLRIDWQQARVVTLLDHDEGDGGAVVCLQLSTCLVETKSCTIISLVCRSETVKVFHNDI